ncbi:MAG TPA: AraC family transcriptional regulator [Roseimicrobium sp.]|nr:AraC family transcriptional regulator [Roseimicrobium sp.]
MRPVFEKTPLKQWESFHCEVLRSATYDAMWHFHPEFQITLVLKSRGHRLVGDNITPLATGDLVLVGSNLPHVWHQDTSVPNPPDAVHAIIVRFLDTFLGRDFLQAPEMEPVRRLLQRASRGLLVKGTTRDKVAAHLERMALAGGLARVAELLAALDVLARSRDLSPIASTGFVPNLKSSDQDRMERVCRYIDKHLTEEIDRNAVAKEANLSVGAFSRFFKLRTGKSLPEYTNELRIGRACRLLLEGDLKITEIALQCGFNNLANFNRRFRDITATSPREYRERFRENAA